MKNILRIPIFVLLGLLLALPGYSEEYKGASNKSVETVKATAAGCLPGASFKYLEVNNVRTRINTGGDMWWDFEVAQYEIPKGSRQTSMFSAALWIGGIDVNDQLKLAALRYRQGPNSGNPGSGNDFWPGPLTIDGTAAISQAECAARDKLYAITRAEVDEYLAWWDNKAAYPGYQIPNSILEWPAHGDISQKQSYYLAPFFDRGGDGDYDPTDGDYPYYDISNELCHSTTQTQEGVEGIVRGGLLADQVIKGDETLWWVFNDNGNIHSETQGTPIGFEIRAQAFGFATNDEINNMTFYSYEIINRSTYRLTGTYFSQWVDTDLGFATDDYVGCDVDRGLGYCYNGKPKDGDGQFWAYGDQPPAIGVDFFQGPYMDPDKSDNPSFNGDGIGGPSFHGDCSIVGLSGSSISMDYVDINTGETVSKSFKVRSEAINGVNFGNGIVDDERFGMRRFVYHNNADAPGPYMQDPRYAPQYYNYLKGIWLDNTKMLYGGNGHISTGAYGPECDFMFPGDTDVCDWGTGGLPPNGPKYWTEEVAQNKEGDRRFMQSAGPFVLEPGAVNYITVGIPWAKAASGGPWASVKLLQVVDDKCQLLFDNCFAVVSGPRAPDLVMRELDKEIIFYIKNAKTNDAGNNFNESYKELDPAILAVANSTGFDFDPYYRFEGYQVFQLKDANVSVADIHDQKLARLVYQSDIKNGVKQLVNHNFDQALNSSVPVEEVNGADLGITHSFKLNEDAFTGQALVNHKQYYYLALAYGYNEYMKYSADPGSQVDGIIGLGGQKKVYLAGRKNIKVYTGIPHKPVGTVAATSSYGDGVEIIRLQGQGNGGNLLELSDESIAEILSKEPADSLNTLGGSDYPIALNPKYKQGRGPVNIKVIDPLSVENADYTLAIDSLVPHYVQIGLDSTINYKANWTLRNLSTNQVYRSDTTIAVQNEQLFPELGISISIFQPLGSGPYVVESFTDSNGDIVNVYDIVVENNGLLESSFTFADSSKTWLSFVPDVDGVPSLNWIRSGVVNDGLNSDYNVPTKPFDPNSNFEKVVSGTWAPYLMTASSDQDPLFGPAFKGISKTTCRFTDMASIDVVFTSDRSKWTRCPVVEMCPDPALAEGKVSRFNIRAAQSVDKDGNPAPVGSGPSNNPDDPNYIAETGMSWFPGYAINLETGERLNLVFGENSWLVGENGRDMKFNPTSNYFTPSFNEMVLGGMHYVYVFSHIGDKEQAVSNVPAYDAGKFLRTNIPNPAANGTFRALVYSSAMWVSIPMAVQGQEWLSNEAKVRIRVSKPYNRYYSVEHDSIQKLTDTQNKNYPMYKFSTKNVATTYNNIEKAKTELDLITVVPNPYYAYSNYETNQLDNRVKITNLPEKCTVTIYSTNGAMIRQFTKDDDATAIEWDLKNYAGIPIAGGVYLIHVKSDGIGEKVVKWFGSLRPIDLNAF